MFLPFGEFLYMLGGSFLQILIPVLFIGSFWRQGQPYATGFALFWAGESTLNLSHYVADARAMRLDLIYDDATHDWNWILNTLHLLQFDHFFGSIL